MPDAQVTIKKVWTSTGNSDHGDWTRYDVQPVEDANTRYKTFKDALGKKAQENESRKVLITFDVKDDNNMITAISDPLDDTVAPASSGGGGGTKMADAPETRASIAAAVALDKAVTYLSVDPGNDDDVLLVADAYYEWLMSKTAAAAPEKPSESVTEASEPTDEQRAKLAGIVSDIDAKNPGSSILADLSVFCKQTFGKEGDLNANEYETLIGYAEGLAHDADLPF